MNCTFSLLHGIAWRSKAQIFLGLPTLSSVLNKCYILHCHMMGMKAERSIKPGLAHTGCIYTPLLMLTGLF